MTERRRPIVSDHAVLRWLQRRYGIDVEGERIKIETLTKVSRALGAKAHSIDGVTFVLREGYVVTTLEPGMSRKREPTHA